MFVLFFKTFFLQNTKKCYWEPQHSIWPPWWTYFSKFIATKKDKSFCKKTYFLNFSKTVKYVLYTVQYTRRFFKYREESEKKTFNTEPKQRIYSILVENYTSGLNTGKTITVFYTPENYTPEFSKNAPGFFFRERFLLQFLRGGLK